MRLLKVFRAVLWSLVGIRKGAEAELHGVRPGTVILVALLVGAMVVLGIAALVRSLTADKRAPQPQANAVQGAGTVKAHGPVVIRDTMEARLAPCLQCHTASTEATRDGYSPRIAGKPAGYLYNQLVSFRDGRRSYPAMVYLLQNLSDDYLREIAAHFSAQDLPYPPPEAGRLSAEEAARAQSLIEKGDPSRNVPPCVACHGKGLTGIEPEVPGILGLPRAYMTAQFGAWRAGKLRSLEPDCMGEVARRLAPQDSVLLATWLAAQPVPSGMKAASRTGELPMKCGSAAPATTQAAPPAARGAAPAALGAALAARGAYLVAAGDCIACHTAPGGAPFAGGRAMETPFGTVYSTNLTPDPKTGIGAWSREDFWRAMHEGRGRDGRALYPAFPYPSFTRVTREDADAIYDHLRSLPAVARANQAHAVGFPYNTRAALWVWRTLYFTPGAFVPEAGKDAQWNRGAYLVRGLGHCDACHAARSFLGGVSHGQDLGGGLIPMQNWYASPLTAPASQGASHAAMAPEDLVALLKSGVSRRGAAMGPMAEVVYRSTQHLSEPDLKAIAAYLQAPGAGEASRAKAPAAPDMQVFQRGAAVYGEHCAQCHGDRGEGAPPDWPALAGNPSLTTPLPANAIKAVIYGGFPPATAANPRPYGMPPYVNRLREQDIAAVVTYVRASWGNSGGNGGGTVTTADVERYR